MPLLRRFTALLTALLFVQLTLLGGRGSCASSVEAQTHPRVDGMQAAHASSTAETAPASDDGCETSHLPSACSSMPSCAAALTPPASEPATTALRPAPATLPEPVAIHSQPAAAPDAPPPRG